MFGAIVFLGFALESFINEVVNERCQDVFDSIEQIPLPDKWFIISKLSTKNILQKNKEPFQSIVLIFKLRNQLAHFKPKFMDYNAKSYQQMRKINHSVVKKLYNNSIEAMKLLAKEFNLENQEWLEDKKL
ncbi:MAG: hypothetical protein NTV07_04345 [Candidatus Omnitrophica bacterium]|nr:hypothetical protein [Candidatus Omnitrophota bacterium]